MPYKSEAQRRFFNSLAGKEKIGEEKVEHWNEVSKGLKLPERAVDRAIRLCDKQIPGQLNMFKEIAEMSSTHKYTITANIHAYYGGGQTRQDKFIENYRGTIEATSPEEAFTKLKKQVRATNSHYYPINMKVVKTD